MLDDHSVAHWTSCRSKRAKYGTAVPMPLGAGAANASVKEAYALGACMETHLLMNTRKRAHSVSLPIPLSTLPPPPPCQDRPGL